MFLVAQVANPANSPEFLLTCRVFQYTDILSCFVKLCDEVCSHTKHVGDNTTVFTTQEVRKKAAHWFIP